MVPQRHSTDYVTVFRDDLCCRSCCMPPESRFLKWLKSEVWTCMVVIPVLAKWQPCSSSLLKVLEIFNVYLLVLPHFQGRELLQDYQSSNGSVSRVIAVDCWIIRGTHLQNNTICVCVIDFIYLFGKFTYCIERKQQPSSSTFEGY